MKCWKNTCGWNPFCVEGSCPSIGGTKKFWTVSERKPHGYPTLMPPDDAKWSGSWVHWGSYDSLKSWNAWRKWFVGKLILSLPKTKIAPGCLPSQTGEISEDLPTNPFLQLQNVSGYPVILQPLRLDRGSASTVLQLHFLEDPPKVTKTAVTTKSSGVFFFQKNTGGAEPQMVIGVFSPFLA